MKSSQAPKLCATEMHRQRTCLPNDPVPRIVDNFIFVALQVGVVLAIRDPSPGLREHLVVGAGISDIFWVFIQPSLNRDVQTGNCHLDSDAQTGNCHIDSDAQTGNCHIDSDTQTRICHIDSDAQTGNCHIDSYAQTGN